MVEELIEVRGPLLELPTLANVVKCITQRGLKFEVLGCDIAKAPEAPSWVRLRLEAANQAELSACLAEITRMGAHLVDVHDASTERVETDGVLPEDFYSLTGLPTEVRIDGKWIAVAEPRPTAAIRLDPARNQALSVPLEKARKGDRILVGSAGVRVAPEAPDRTGELFALVGTTLSVGQARGPVIVNVAREVERTQGRGERVLLVAGPAVIHSGAGAYLQQLVRARRVDLLVAPSATAVYDVEWALFGTARGMYVSENLPAVHGARNTLHALNLIRKAGGLKPAVDTGLLKSGVLHACVTTPVPFLLIGAVRDEAALPDTITDTVAAREALRSNLQGVGLALMIATAELSKAVLAALPGSVQKVCVDVSEYDVNKIVARGEPSVFGLVESAESFLRELARNLGAW